MTNNWQQIDNVIAKLKAENIDCFLSVSPSHQFLWEEVDEVAKSINYDYQARPRHQNMQPQYLEKDSKPRLGRKLEFFREKQFSSLHP